MKDVPSRSLPVNFVSVDTSLTRLLLSYSGEYLYTISHEPLPAGKALLYVLPVAAGFSQENLLSPVFYYGQARHLSRAFYLGASDYLKEPWSFEELECRIARFIPVDRLSYPWGSLCLAPCSLRSSLGSIPLLLREYFILRQLIINRGEVVPRETLLYVIGYQGNSSTSRVVDVHISSLRKKIQTIIPKETPPIIVTVRPCGYLLT